MSQVSRSGEDSFVDAGMAMARKIFEKRGNHSEVHLNEGELAGFLAIAISNGVKAAQSEKLAPVQAGIVQTYTAKIERDAATMKVLRILLREAFDFLNAQVVLPEDYDDWEKRYKAFTESLDRLAGGVAFITDERVGGP